MVEATDIRKDLQAALEGMPMAEDGTIANSILEMSRYATTAIALDVGRSEFALLREDVGVMTPSMKAFYHLGGMAAMLEVFGVGTLEELEMALKLYVESFPKGATQ